MATIQQYFSIGSSTSAKWLNDDEFVYLSTKSGVNQIWKKTLSTGKEEQLTFLESEFGAFMSAMAESFSPWTWAATNRNKSTASTRAANRSI